MDSARKSRVDAADAAFVLDRWMTITANHLRADQDATINQFWMLLLASERPAISIARAAGILELNYTTIAECAAQLVVAGALEKTSSEDDGRQALITTTAAGERLIGVLDQSLIATAKDALSLLDGERRVQGLRLFFDACTRLGKKRMMGNLVRGDSVFVITCQQTAIEFGHLCKRHLVNSLQGHTLMTVGKSGGASMGELRRHLLLDAPSLSRTISRLVDRGLANRDVGASRREANVTLTASGLQCASMLTEETEGLLRRLFGDDYGTSAYHQTIAALRASLEEYTQQR